MPHENGVLLWMQIFRGRGKQFRILLLPSCSFERRENLAGAAIKIALLDCKLVRENNGWLERAESNENERHTNIFRNKIKRDWNFIK